MAFSQLGAICNIHVVITYILWILQYNGVGLLFVLAVPTSHVELTSCR